MESYDKDMGILGDSWGRGKEDLYHAMGLKMPEKVKEMTSKEGYYMISSEVLPDYVGDYLIVSKYNDQDNSYQQSDLYKEMPAVKNNHVIEVCPLKWTRVTMGRMTKKESSNFMISANPNIINLPKNRLCRIGQFVECVNDVMYIPYRT